MTAPQDSQPFHCCSPVCQPMQSCASCVASEHSLGVRWWRVVYRAAEAYDLRARLGQLPGRPCMITFALPGIFEHPGLEENADGNNIKIEEWSAFAGSM